VETKSSVGGLILNPKNQILLQRKDEEAWFWPNYWCTFGGAIRDNEDSLEAFNREVKEELGLEFSDVKFFSSIQALEVARTGPKKGFKRIINSHFYATRFDGNLKNIRLGEGAGLSFFDEEEIAKYNQLGLVIPHVYEAIQKLYESLRAGTFKI